MSGGDRVREDDTQGVRAAGVVLLFVRLCPLMMWWRGLSLLSSLHPSVSRARRWD